MCCIYGVFIVSMVVVSITNALEMNNMEVKSYNILQRLKIKEKMKQTAAMIIGNMARIPRMKKKSVKARKRFTLRLMEKAKEFKDYTQYAPTFLIF